MDCQVVATSLETPHEARRQAANSSNPSQQDRGSSERPDSALPGPACGRPTCHPPAEDGPARSGLSLPVGEQPAPGEDRQRANGTRARTSIPAVILNGMPALSSNPSSADESSRAHDPSSAFRQQGDCPWCVLVSDNQRRMDHRPPSSVEGCPREDSPHDHPGNPSANHLCSSSSSNHCGSSALPLRAAASLPPCSGPGEPCPSTPLCAPPPASSHSGILTRGQPTLEAIGLAGQDLFGEGSDRGSHRSTHHRCQYPLPHAVRDLPSGGPTGRHGDNPPSGRTPPRDASSSYSERYQASCCDLQSIPRRPHACSNAPGLFPGTPTPTLAVGPTVTPSNTRDTTSSRPSSYHEGSGHLRPLGSPVSCPSHNPAITPDLSSAIDLRQPPTLLPPRFLTPDLHHSPALVRSATAPPTTSASASKAHCPICRRGPFSVLLNGNLHRHTCLSDLPPRVRGPPLPFVPVPVVHHPTPDDPAVAPVVPPARHRPQPSNRQRLYDRWLDELYTLLLSAAESTTKGQLDARVLALLHHSPAQSTVLPHTSSDLGRTAALEPTDDLLLGGHPIPDPSPPSANLRAVHRHLRNGDAIKARRAATGAPVGSVADPRTRALLAAKYVADPVEWMLPSDESILRDKMAPIDRTALYVEDTTILQSHILGKKRGSSSAPSGQSHDHYRDLLQRHPDAIHPLTSLCNLVAGDNLTDGPERMALVTGKGTVLLKANSDVRPIVTEEPLWHYVGHLLARTYRTTIQTVSGPTQYMHLSGGCEIVAHTIRALLESDSSLVVGKVDCCNAFNAIHKHPILQVIADEAPALLPFTNCLLNKAPAGTIYHDSREQVTVVHKLTEGVPQGGAMSSALFNMGQSVAIRPAAAAHPQARILLIADDTHVVGTPEAVIAAILDIRERYAAIGLSLAPTTSSKNVLYGLGNEYTDQQRASATAAGLHWIPPTQGLEIGGSPVGSPQYMSSHLNKCVDGIIAELTRFEGFINAPAGSPKARLQLVYALIRLCTSQQLSYHLRTTPPSATALASSRLDIAIANTILRITNSLPYLPPSDSENMRPVLNRFFMSLRLGGDGFQQSEEVLHSAYVASILQCASSMHALLPDGHHRQPTTTPSLTEFCTSLELLRARGVTVLADVTFSAMWTAQRSKIQRLISQQLQLQRQQRELASLPNLPPAHAAAVHHPLSPDDFAIRQQGLINCLCPESSHWLQANPAFWINRLTDNAFMIAFWVRSKFRVMGPRRYCICGEPVDCLGDHVLSCPRVTVRNQVRNTAHASLSSQLRRCISSHSASSEYVVAAGEPPLARYLESNLPVIHPAAADDDDPWRAHDPTHPARRADLALITHSGAHPSTILIDVTIAAHNSRAAGRASLPGCAAEARYAAKAASYARDYRPPPDDVQLLFFSVETSGFIHHMAKDFLKRLLASSNTAYLQALQSISVALQSARAHSISVAREFLTLDSPPTLPYTAGPLPQVPPPSSPARLLVPRFYALNPTPARPLPDVAQ